MIFLSDLYKIFNLILMDDIAPEIRNIFNISLGDKYLRPYIQTCEGNVKKKMILYISAQELVERLKKDKLASNILNYKKIQEKLQISQ